MLLAMCNYLVTVPGLGTFAITARDTADALAQIAADVWRASYGTVAVDMRFCRASRAIGVTEGVALFV